MRYLDTVGIFANTGFNHARATRLMKAAMLGLLAVLAFASVSEAARLADDRTQWLQLYNADNQRVVVLAWVAGVAAMLDMVTPSGCSSGPASTGMLTAATADVLQRDLMLMPMSAVLVAYVRLNPNCKPAIDAAIKLGRSVRQD